LNKKALASLQTSSVTEKQILTTFSFGPGLIFFFQEKQNVIGQFLWQEERGIEAFLMKS